MSEPYYYPICESHDPPIIGTEPVGRGSGDLFVLRRALREPAEGAAFLGGRARSNLDRFLEAHVGCKVGLVDGSRRPVPLVEPKPHDAQTVADAAGWQEIASHEAFQGHSTREKTLLASMLARLDELVIAERQRDAAREAIRLSFDPLRTVIAHLGRGKP